MKRLLSVDRLKGLMCILSTLFTLGEITVAQRGVPGAPQAGIREVNHASDKPVQIPAKFTRPRGESRVFSLDPDLLLKVKQEIQTGSSRFDRAIRELLNVAEKEAKVANLTVVDKTLTPPSGDKHDYMSLARYWWPNPQTADGLPYVR